MQALLPRILIMLLALSLPLQVNAGSPELRLAVTDIEGLEDDRSCLPHEITRAAQRAHGLRSLGRFPVPHALRFSARPGSSRPGF